MLLLWAVVVVGAGLTLSVAYHFNERTGPDFRLPPSRADEFDRRMGELSRQIKEKISLQASLRWSLVAKDDDAGFRNLLRQKRELEISLDRDFAAKEALLLDRMAIEGVRPGDHAALEKVRRGREECRENLAAFDQIERTQDLREALRSMRQDGP